MSSLIELKNISKIYQTSATSLTALDNINLSIQKHELIAIMGVSGSGKSTLMNIIGLLDRPSIGTYYLDDESTASLTDDKMAHIRNKKIGFVFQSFFLLKRFSIEQNIILPLLYRGEPLNDAKRKARETLEKLGISHLYQHKPYQLSGGEQQRVAIARALIGNPEIILADEPTGSLDSKTGQDVIDLFIQLNKCYNKTIVIVTHDVEIAKRCNRMMTLKDGQFVDEK